MDLNDADRNPFEIVIEPPARQIATERRKRFRQVSLRTLLLLTAAVAVWVAHGKNHYDNARYARQIEAMRPLVRELYVEDPSQIAVVKQDERWYDQNEWRVYLPPGEYRLCIATHDVDEAGMAPVAESIPLAAGTREIALDQNRTAERNWKVLVTVDGEEVIRVNEPAAWDAGRGSSGGGLHSSVTQLPPREPAILFRRRFSVKTAPNRYSTPKGPSNGLLLWIEPDG